MKSLLKISLFLILSSDLIASPSAIKPSKAILESNVGEMEVEMKLLDNGLWKLTSLLDGGSIVRREESEIFELIENKIKPLNYSFNQRILFRKYKASADFDWEKLQVSFIENKDSGEVDLLPNVLGPSSASLQLRLDFRNLKKNNIPQQISYNVYWRGTVKIRTYDVNPITESVETPMGVYKAYRVTRKFDEGSERSQIFWLAPELDYSVIKIYDKNEREVEIKIKNFEEIG